MQSSRSLNQANAAITPFPSVISINDIWSCLFLQRFKIRRFDWRESSNWNSLELRHFSTSFPCSHWGSTSYVSIKFGPNCLPFLAIFIVIPIPMVPSFQNRYLFLFLLTKIVLLLFWSIINRHRHPQKLYRTDNLLKKSWVLSPIYCSRYVCAFVTVEFLRDAVVFVSRLMGNLQQNNNNQRLKISAVNGKRSIAANGSGSLGRYGWKMWLKDSGC